VKNKILILALGLTSFAGVSAVTTSPASSATCSYRAANLIDVRGTSAIRIANGLEYFTVTNPTPFIPGMRVRAITGLTLNTTKYVEGMVGIIRNCEIGILIDETHGNGFLKNSRFSVAGIVGLSGPTGAQGAAGATGIQGVQGLQGIPGTNGSNGINGINGTNGLNGINGFIPKFGSFSDTTTQTVDAINTPKAMTFNQITPGVNGVVANGVSVASGSRITVAVGGIYHLVYSAQLTKTDAGNDTMDIWLRVNGVDVPLSNSESTLSTTQRLVSTSSWMLTLASGDYVQLMYSSADINTRITAIPAQTGPVRPSGPSVITTMLQVQ